MKDAGFALYNQLKKQGFEVILDDRGASAGIQFSDADLLGVPLRVIFGKKNFENGLVEIATRDKSQKENIPNGEVFEFIKKWIENKKSEISV
jgi:prolyl-tRNA synthetase